MNFVTLTPQLDVADILVATNSLAGSNVRLHNVDETLQVAVELAKPLSLSGEMHPGKLRSIAVFCEWARLSSETIGVVQTAQYKSATSLMKAHFGPGRYDLASDLDSLARLHNAGLEEEIDTEIGLGAELFELVKSNYDGTKFNPDGRELLIELMSEIGGSKYSEDKIFLDLTDIQNIFVGDYLFLRQGSGLLKECFPEPSEDYPSEFCNKVRERAGLSSDDSFVALEDNTLPETRARGQERFVLSKYLVDSVAYYGQGLTAALLSELRNSLLDDALNAQKSRLACEGSHKERDVSDLSCTKDTQIFQLPAIGSILKRSGKHGISSTRTLFAHEIAHFLLDHDQARLTEIYSWLKSDQSYRVIGDEDANCMAFTILEAEADIEAAVLVFSRDLEFGTLGYWGQPIYAKESDPSYKDDREFFLSQIGLFEGAIASRELAARKCSHFFNFSRHILFSGLYSDLMENREGN